MIFIILGSKPVEVKTNGRIIKAGHFIGRWCIFKAVAIRKGDVHGRSFSIDFGAATVGGVESDVVVVAGKRQSTFWAQTFSAAVWIIAQLSVFFVITKVELFLAASGFYD